MLKGLWSDVSHRKLARLRLPLGPQSLPPADLFFVGKVATVSLGLCRSENRQSNLFLRFAGHCRVVGLCSRCSHTMALVMILHKDIGTSFPLPSGLNHQIRTAITDPNVRVHVTINVIEHTRAVLKDATGGSIFLLDCRPQDVAAGGVIDSS